MNYILNVGMLKKFLKNIDDDATIVLQIENKGSNETYVAMDDDAKIEYDESINTISLVATYTDKV